MGHRPGLGSQGPGQIAADGFSFLLILVIGGSEGRRMAFTERLRQTSKTGWPIPLSTSNQKQRVLPIGLRCGMEHDSWQTDGKGQVAAQGPPNEDSPSNVPHREWIVPTERHCTKVGWAIKSTDTKSGSCVSGRWGATAWGFCAGSHR